MKHRQGSEVIALHTTSIVRDSSGKFVQYQGTFLDVTGQREMERQLQREQEFARRLIDSFPDVVVTIDNEANCTFISPQAFEAVGYHPEDLVGKQFCNYIDRHDCAALQHILDSLISGSRAYGEIGYRMLHKNGSWRAFRASARTLHDETGRAVGLIVSARDITEQQRLQQQLIQSERLSAMGRMIAGVAHELNNPLTAILGVTELMRDGTTDEVTRRHLDLAHRQAQRAAHIVQSLLFFSRPVTPHKSLLHLSDLLQRTLQLHEHALRTNQIRVDFVERPELPPCSAIHIS